jgi:hypothetical protein
MTDTPRQDPYTTHPCPGSCGARVPKHLLACRTCWFRLPAYLRDRVNRTHRQDPAAHRKAVADAVTWYRNNPGGGG